MKNQSKSNLDSAMSAILAGYKDSTLPLRHVTHTPMPNKCEIIDIILNLHRILFPGFFENGEDSVLKSEDALDQLLYETYYRLKRQIMLAFSFFAKEVPGVFYWLGCRQEGAPFYPLHSNQFCPDEEAMRTGIAMLVSAACHQLT